MKNFNLIKRLFMDSHEKQTPQRFGRYAVMLIMLLTLGVGQAHAWGVYFNVSGWWKNDGATFRVHYWWGDTNGDVALTSIGTDWYYAELPAANHNWNFQLQRINPSTGSPWSYGGNIYDKGDSQIVTRSGDTENTSTTYTAGWQNADPSNNRWVTVYKDGGASTRATSVDAGYADAVVAGNTVSLNLDQFGAWLWKTRTGESTYTGGIGKLHLNYRLGKDGGSTGDWHDTYTTVVSSENKSGDGKTWYQCWKWDDDLDILSNLTTKANLNSGVYYIEYYWSAEVNRATGHANYPETIVFNRSGSNYYIKFTIPQPEVTISGHPLVGFESMVTAEKVSSKLIEGQTVKYKFERYNGSSWVTAQDYSTKTTYVYTPTSTTDKVRVIMKVDQTSEESTAAVQDVYEQYYVYVEDSYDWGSMWLHMEANSGTEKYLGKNFPGEQLLPYDTINGKAIYRIKLDNYYDHFWLSDGTTTNQTFSSGIRIQSDDGGNKAILSSYAGNYYMIKTDDAANNCYLRAYPTTIYRIASYDGATSKTYYSNAISSTEAPGTVSFFANTGNASSTVKIQTWTGDAANLNGSWATGATNYKATCATASATGNVFTGTLTSSALSDVAKYEGDYYIHVMATTRNYLTSGSAKSGTIGPKFTHFEKNSRLFGDTYNYYWVDWFLAQSGGQSVVATVGNTYNIDLAGTLASDANAPYGMTTEDGANVRYGYDPTTNYFCRSMVTGGGSDVKIKADAPSTVTIGGEDAYTEARSFSDATNWVYTVDATVKGQSTASVQTTYNGNLQTLLASKKLLGGESETDYTVVLSYDLKTNRVIAAWKPTGTIATEFNLESNLMVVRTENGRPTVLNVTADADIHNVSQIYTVLEITEANWNKSGGNADRRIVSPGFIDEYYWISLPYECQVSDIFGIPDYGSGNFDHWVLQTYRGDLRAKTGWWAETNAWWYDLERTDTLKANEGYVLRLTNLGTVFPGTGTKLQLYFPSSKTGLTIEPLGESVTTKLDTMRCHVWRKWKSDPSGKEGENNPIWDRRAVDSNWRVIGSPSFNSTKISSPIFITTDIDANKDGYISLAEQQAAIEAYLAANPGATPYSLKYFYDWEVVDGQPKFSIADASTTEFIATHAHLVQYEGDITWVKYDNSNPLVGIAAAPARKNDNELTLEQTLRLVLKRGETEADVAYISRMLFGATEGYDVNMDLSKMTNANSANIYTYGELYKMAGNCLPDSVSTIKVGVQLAAEGNYTFSMPDGTNGTGVTLVDNVTGEQTNLALTDYTVNLPEGETNDRFTLVLSPIAQTPTSFEDVSDQHSAIRKVMVDGVLYIVKDGEVFDARGNRVR